jgi:hypothetical protein
VPLDLFNSEFTIMKSRGKLLRRVRSSNAEKILKGDLFGVAMGLGYTIPNLIKP